MTASIANTPMIRNRMTSLGRAAALTVLMALPFASGFGAAHARDVGSLGGNGGGPFRETCQPNNKLYGFYIWSGKALDAIQPVCTGAKTNPNEEGVRAYALNRVGGKGGSEDYQLYCRSEFAVKGIHVFMDRHNIVNHVRITCARITDPSDQYKLKPNRLQGESIQDVVLSCQDGEWATGVYGRAGALVDQIGLQCERIGSIGPSPRPADPVLKPTQSTGPSPFAQNPVCMIGGVARTDIAQSDCYEAQTTGCVRRKLTPRQYANCLAAQPKKPSGEEGVVAILDADIYDMPGGRGRVIGLMRSGDTATMAFPNPRNDNWCSLSGLRNVGNGWVYCGPDYNPIRVDK